MSAYDDIRAAIQREASHLSPLGRSRLVCRIGPAAERALKAYLFRVQGEDFEATEIDGVPFERTDEFPGWDLVWR